MSLKKKRAVISISDAVSPLIVVRATRNFIALLWGFAPSLSYFTLRLKSRKIGDRIRTPSRRALSCALRRGLRPSQTLPGQEFELLYTRQELLRGDGICHLLLVIGAGEGIRTPDPMVVTHVL